MSDSTGSDPFGFGKFIPGFDFLQSLAQGAAGAAGGATAPLSGMAQWVAPTLNVEEIDKRIQELRTVQFWLEQNGRALTATIQALEVQKMTLAALQSMQGGLGEWAQAAAKAPDGAVPPEPAPKPTPEAEAPPASPAAAGIEPLQWWGALTQQFQQIATQALQDPASQKAMEAGTQMAGDFARSAMQASADLAQAVQPADAPAARQRAARKTAKSAAQSAAKKPAAAKKTGAAAKTPRR